MSIINHHLDRQKVVLMSIIKPPSGQAKSGLYIKVAVIVRTNHIEIS